MEDQKHRFETFEAGRLIMANVPLAMVLTDPNRADNPIIYVNGAFEQTTGYSASMAIGRNCRFLQGDDSDQPGVAALRQAVNDRQSLTVDLRNYRADGTAFKNRLMMAPILDDNGDLFAFIGIQIALEDEDAVVHRTRPRVDDLADALHEMQHRVKNHLQMVASMIRLQSSSDEPPEQAYKLLSRRIESLSALYDEFSMPPETTNARYDVVSAGGYVSRVVNTVGALDGRRDIRVMADVDAVFMRCEDAAQLGLLTSELLSNALQHAFKDRAEGLIEVRLKQAGGDRMRLTVSDDGIGLGDSEWPEKGNSGAKIVRGLVRGLDGDLGVSSGGSGTVITVNFQYNLPTGLEKGGARVVEGPQGDDCQGETIDRIQ